MYTYTVADIFFFSSLRGLILDTQKGNILKIDKDGFILGLVLKLCATAISSFCNGVCVVSFNWFPWEQDV